MTTRKAKTPATEKTEYKTNFLTNVVIRVDFPSILELEGEGKPESFQKVILTKYPIIEEQKGEGFMFKLNPESSPKITSEKKSTWLFSNKERDKRITLSSNFLALEFFKYKAFTDFREEFENIFDLLKKLYPIGIINRFGLRYINEIKILEGNSLDYSGYLNINLIGVINNFLQAEDKTMRAMHLLSIRGDEGILNFQFGIFNPEYPNPIARKEFILDYDYYSETEIDPENIKGMAVRFNQFITNWFERSIDTKLKSLMNK